MGKGDSRRAHRPGQTAANKPPAGEPAAPRLAGPGPARLPKASIPPLTSRTTTLDDPLTTSLLAEIARRPSTVEMSPAQLAEARAMAPGAQDAEAGADRADRDPDDPARDPA
ncbi:MAG TPA: hypothetical protein VHT91_08440 [Kofleriaceae bacterium]|jgi:hypothetical protein|nr:hypothetical protein [Kofleriaceae bacterium]